MGLLNDLANRYRTDKGSDGPGYHSYTKIYEEYFDPVRHSVSKVLEIGVGGHENPNIAFAASLFMWRDYFPNAHIYAIDVDPKRMIQENRITSCVCDQTNPDSLEAMAQNFGAPFDIILDDGSHYVSHQQISLACLFKHVKPGGFYVIEDLHTSLWGWGLHPSDKNTTLNVLCRFVKKEGLQSSFIRPEICWQIERETKWANVWISGTDHATGILQKRE